MEREDPKINIQTKDPEIVNSANNLKEDDKDKKHIGVVIDNDSKANTTPDEIIAENGKGVDLYSMISISWKAIQEQQQIIEQLQEEINKLKKGDEK